MRKEFNYLQFKDAKLNKEEASNIYNDLINYCKYEEIEGYTETHHILPKSIGGTDEKENLVKLSFPEHLFAHYLLAIIYFPNYGLIRAFIFMSCSNQDASNIKCEEDILVNFTEFETYSLLREQNSINQSKRHSSFHTKYTIIINNNKYVNLYKNDLPALFKNLNLTKVVYNNKPINIKTVCYRPSIFSDENNIIYLKTLNTLSNINIDEKLHTSADSNIGKANINFKEQFYKTKVENGFYKKYVFIINGSLYIFTRKELKLFLIKNNIKCFENCNTGRVHNNLKQLINHIDRYIKDGIIRLNVF